MRKTFILMSMMLFVGLAAQAQRGEGGQRPARLSPEEASKQQAETFQEELGLSDEQYKKTYDVLLAAAKSNAEKMTEMRSSGSFDRETFQKMALEAQADKDKKLKEIFSATQWTGYEAWKKANPPRTGRGGGGGARGGN